MAVKNKELEQAVRLGLGRRLDTAKKYFEPAGPKYNVKAICNSLTLTRKEFEEFTGASANHYWVDKAIGFNKPDLEEKVCKLLLLAVLSDDLFADKTEGQFWLRFPNTALDKVSPLKFALQGNIDQVIDMLNSIAQGNVVA